MRSSCCCPTTVHVVDWTVEPPGIGSMQQSHAVLCVWRLVASMRRCQGGVQQWLRFTHMWVYSTMTPSPQQFRHHV